MRKLSSVMEESRLRRARRNEERKLRLERLGEWMGALDAADIPCKSHSAATSRRLLRDHVRNGTCSPVGIECDECGTEMVNLNETLAVMPPRSRIQCPGCGMVASVDPEYVR